MAMTFTVLTGLKTVTGSIKSWQNYAQVDAAGVLTDAEAWIYQKLRVREMRTSENLSVAAAKSYIDLPDGYLDPIKLRDITNDVNLIMVSEDQLEEYRTYTSGVLDSNDPAWWAVFDEAIQFDCKATTALTARMVFYKQLDALSTSNETNFLTQRYPHILRHACLAFAALFSKDSELFATEIRLAESLVMDANAQDELSRRGQENPVT